MKKATGIFFLLFVLISSCRKEEKEGQFKKLPSSKTGITFSNTLDETTEHNILTYLYYYNGAGVAAGDFNNDSLIDLYFTSNQGADKLYLNKGGFTFEDITEKAKIKNETGWTTGVTHVDINADGLLDIYICKVGTHKSFKGKNLLFVNQGVDKNGIPIFKEQASEYNLDFSGFSTHAAFLDYDIDGDLDIYLLNHSINPNRSYGKGSKRKVRDSVSGDVLFRNDNGYFTDVSGKAGIFQGAIGYGLGLSVSDINNDGYPDIYVGNDFFENDYLYINQKDGSFLDIISEDQTRLGHTTHFSMGNDIADINNDGWTDIISLDMLPQNLETYKTSGLEYAYPIYQQYLKNGFSPQYMQNTLHLNLGNENFSEIANSSGIAATEWSWGALFADFDNDGLKDLFVSNGIKGATNDMDFISFIANEKIQRRIETGMTEKEMMFIKEIPEKKVPNHFFKNNGDLTFNDVTDSWYRKENSFSNGAVYADLDNDGDLDLVVNNVDTEALVLENLEDSKSDSKKSIQVTFKGSHKNTYGIGAKLMAHTPSGTVVQENFVGRGYLSSVPGEVHFGIGQDSTIDSLTVIWPDGKFELLKSISIGKIRVEEKNASGNFYETQNPRGVPLFTQNDSLVLPKHKDLASTEFDVSPLVPFANTNEGPSISVADINKDGLEDILISGGKTQATQLMVQNQDGTFTSQQEGIFEKDAFNEDVAHIFFDANGDEFMDLVIVSGGNEFTSSPRIQPRFYFNSNGNFVKNEQAFKGLEINASNVATVDFDNDGDMDLTITSDQVPRQFGTIASQYIFENDGSGNFTDVTERLCPQLKHIGNVKDLFWSDLDDNGYKDLVLVGHWMPIQIFMNNGKLLQLNKNAGLDGTQGFWNSVVVNDFDNDGDQDLVVGNWGNNSKLFASQDKPITLYKNDFDNNGSIEPLVTYFHDEKETPFSSKDELVKQMPFLNKKFLSYKSFAEASLEELFGSEKLENSQQKKIHELSSCYFENMGNNSFVKHKLPFLAQVAPINDMLIYDFDSDGKDDIIAVGNKYEISTQLGRMDASHGMFLRFTGQGFEWFNNANTNIKGPARSIEKITIKEKENIVIGINNSFPLLFEKTKNE